MKIMYYITTLLFGVKIQGERLPESTSLPAERPFDSREYIKWCNDFKVGSRYGHRGSFYQN
jgi:hypothetical protein